MEYTFVMTQTTPVLVYIDASFRCDKKEKF